MTTISEIINTPLLQLPHTFFKYDRDYIVPSGRYGNDDNEVYDVVGLLALIELVERGHVTVDISGMDVDPPCEFYIHSIPAQLQAAFVYFESQREYLEYYDLEDINALGRSIASMPSTANNGPLSLLKLKDALKGGVDEWTGLEYLAEMFPDGDNDEGNEISETVWGVLDEKRQLMIDQLRIQISLVTE